LALLGFFGASAGRKHLLLTDAWAIFDQTQLPDTSIASPSTGLIVIF
jgi:hypothetical protein